MTRRPIAASAARLALACVFLGLAAAPQGARAATADTLAVSSLKLPPAFSNDREKIEEAVRTGLTDAGFSVQDPRRTAQRLAGRSDVACSAEPCLRDLATVTESRFIVQGQLTSSPRTYTIDIKLFDSADGQQVAAVAVECRIVDICPPLVPNVQQNARELGKKAHEALRIARATASTAAAPATAGIAPATTGQTGAPPLIIANPPPTGRRDPQYALRLRRAVPWAGLTLGGLAVGATGVFLMTLDGEGTCDLAPNQSKCPRSYRTNAIGIGAIAVGAAAVVAGVVGTVRVLRRPDGTELSLAVTPSSLLVAGRF